MPAAVAMNEAACPKIWMWAATAFLFLTPVSSQADEVVSGAAQFHQEIEPMLKAYCYDCHGDGANKGNVAFDDLGDDQAVLQNRDLWWKALKNVRAGLMPPAKRTERPTEAEKEKLAAWIKADVFDLDPARPDPGRVTIRRLNRVEYRNTIRDLMGVDYDTSVEFPPDDTGNGFDDLGEVLTLSPMLMEKYLDAAQAIVAKAVPTSSKVVAERTLSGATFHQGPATAHSRQANGSYNFSYYEAASVSNEIQVEHPGRYQLALNLVAGEKYVENEFDDNQCRFIFTVDGEPALSHDFTREGNHLFHYEFDEKWQPGPHVLAIQVEPLTPGQKQVRSLVLRVNNVILRGPFDEKYEVPPPRYAEFFPKAVPQRASARRDYARQLLHDFAFKAFRRPPDEAMVDKLVALAENTYTQPNQTFEAGVAQAMTAVLASPGFLFREEGAVATPHNGLAPLVDEYSLASRLSYFLWSSMPDEELFKMAGANLLRKNLSSEVARLLDDSRSAALVDNFSGQWLETRDIATVPIDAKAVLARDDDPNASMTNAAPHGNGAKTNAVPGKPPNHPRGNAAARTPPRIDLTADIRADMRTETEKYFAHIISDDAKVEELIDSDYTFLNEPLARYYSLTNLHVTGNDFDQVMLPDGCVRGGILTMGSVLAVTSNPTRTSPVKRGLFILDNILGTPSPPPPANIPPLEDAEAGFKGRKPVLREILEKHRSQPMCASCHDRLDPPGLALENFNALGLYRQSERGQPIETAGQLATGETFANVRELKHILATQHRIDFYRCLTEKLLTYAVGRSLDYHDVETVDQIVNQLEQHDGHFSALLNGVIESAPFQRQGTAPALAESRPVPAHHVQLN